MAGKKNGKNSYRRVSPQQTALAPVHPPGNHPLPAGLQKVAPAITRPILPGEAPIQQRVTERRVRQERFDGPIPHPDIFRKYGEVIPDAPERILKVFEEDSEHIRYMQREALVAHREDSRRVQWMAFALITGGYAMAVLFAILKEITLAGIVLTTTIIGTVVGFLQNRHQQSTSTNSRGNGEAAPLATQGKPEVQQLKSESDEG